MVNWLPRVTTNCEDNELLEIPVLLILGAHKTRDEILTAAHCFNNKLNRLDRIKVTWHGIAIYQREIDKVLVGKTWADSKIKFTDDIAWVFLKPHSSYQTEILPIANLNFTMLRK